MLPRWRPASGATSATARSPRSPASKRKNYQRALDRLVGSELLFQRGTAPDASYTFKHALVRDAAANSLLRSEFRKVNGAIAASFAASDQPPPAEVIAWHAELAGLDSMSVDYLLLAGRNANARYANQEAINHLERALRLIAGLPETPERTALELRSLTMIGVPRIALHGYSSSEVEASYRRIVELADRAGDKQQLFQGLRGLWNCIYDRADLENAKLIADRLCDLAVDHPAPERGASPSGPWVVRASAWDGWPKRSRRSKAVRVPARDWPWTPASAITVSPPSSSAASMPPCASWPVISIGHKVHGQSARGG